VFAEGNCSLITRNALTQRREGAEKKRFKS
jgi:hypothetical protein